MFYYDRKGRLVKKEEGGQPLSGSEIVPSSESSSEHGYVLVNNEISTTREAEEQLQDPVNESSLRTVQDVFYRDGQGQLRKRGDVFYEDSAGELKNSGDIFYRDGKGILRRRDDHYFYDGEGILRERDGHFYSDGWGRHPGLER